MLLYFDIRVFIILAYEIESDLFYCVTIGLLLDYSYIAMFGADLGCCYTLKYGENLSCVLTCKASLSSYSLLRERIFLRFGQSPEFIANFIHK